MAFSTSKGGVRGKSLTKMMGNVGKMEKTALSWRVSRGNGPNGGKMEKRALSLKVGHGNGPEWW